MEYVMAYTDANRAVYVGMERVVGSLAGVVGSFVMRDSGTFDVSNPNGAAHSEYPSEDSANRSSPR